MYLELDAECREIPDIEFSSPLFDCCYDALDTLEACTFEGERKTITLTTEAVKPAECTFNIEDTAVRVSPFYTILHRDRSAHQPFTVTSKMHFEFEPTND